MMPGSGCQAGGQRGGGDAAVIGGEVGIPRRSTRGRSARPTARARWSRGRHRRQPSRSRSSPHRHRRCRPAARRRRESPGSASSGWWSWSRRSARPGRSGPARRHDATGHRKVRARRDRRRRSPQTRVAQRAHRAGHDTVGPADVRGRQDGAIGPAVPANSRRRASISSAGSPAAVSSSTRPDSKRSSSAPTGSSTRVMPATANRAGDDAHLVGAVARIVGLPQRVTAPPAANIAVDDRHEVDRLAGVLHRSRKKATSAGCRMSTVAAGYADTRASVAACGSVTAPSAKMLTISPVSASCRRASARCSIR